VKRILLVRLSAMGDVVQSLGPIAALHAARPDLELWYLTQRPFVPLFAHLPGVTGFVEHDRDGGVAGFFSTAAAVRRLGCEIALDLQGNWKSAVFARVSGARERVGAAADWRREPSSRVLLPRLVATDAEIDIAAHTVRGCGIDPDRPFRVHVLTDPHDPRTQAPRFAALDSKHSPLPILWLAGPDDGRALAPAVAALLRQGRGELRQLIGLGALLARIGGEVVGPDQGATHVLSACGARTTVLFGPQDPALTAPPGARVVQHAQPPDCMPCRLRLCSHPQGPVCMAFTSRDGREFARPDWLPPLPH
jgi:heptosyltransferase-1